MMTQPAILLCGHGSRDVEAITEFEALAGHISRHLPERKVMHGFLEFARPTIGERLDDLRNGGATDILAVPGMLFAAGHAKNDIPSVLNDYAASHDGFSIRYGRELAVDIKLLAAARERIAAAEAEAGDAVSRADTLLVVVGRGTNDPDANSNVSKVARMLWEGMGFGWTETCYSGVAQPLVADALERVVRLGFRRIIVFPYFLFTGILVKRIYSAADVLAGAHPEVEVIKASYLNDHPLVIDAFLERLEEIPAGENLMNCQLCKYREQIIGYEKDKGAAQVGHHHHVEGIGTDADHDHGHHHHHHGQDDDA
ncbi:MAG: sirohydrochlorin chelatase [Rhodospirillaceae bacterium]|nr:sirohydrochlorin chelatase [Rhodospirillaceae bacterium]MBT7292871.1 sirohydrochlorin chelatase [Rhodospirillaceae bacterium]